MAKAGVALTTAQKLARHSDPKLTSNVYTLPKERAQIEKAFLIAKPMIKASWTKCCGVGGGSVDG
ncbi:MAG: hypothetical protein HQ581_17500 [Planctomycetes bacterium]|nr:hypothetical protein [Planctomycetota bacterium]